jgi:hypothetical protein
LWLRATTAFCVQTQQLQLQWPRQTPRLMPVNYTPLQSPLVESTLYNHTRVSLFHTQLYSPWLPLPIVSAFLDSWQTRAMDLPTPSDIDTGFSRARLKDIAAWIRDDLDKLVTRRGPDSLKPDDVLTLHDIFVALRKSTTMRASDLRASGIHNAIAWSRMARTDGLHDCALNVTRSSLRGQRSLASSTKSAHFCTDVVEGWRGLQMQLSFLAR